MSIINRRLSPSLWRQLQLPSLSSPTHIRRSLATTHRHTHQSILTEIHPEHLYQIIINVDEYQHFLPYCKESKVLQVSPCKTMMDAVLRVGLPLGSSGLGTLMEERYISRVRMTPAADCGDRNEQYWIVEAKSIRSQFLDSLKSRWRLNLVETGENQQASCNVNFDVEVQVSNPLISFTLDKVLKDVAKKQVDAFEKRCRSEG